MISSLTGKKCEQGVGIHSTLNSTPFHLQGKGGEAKLRLSLPGVDTPAVAMKAPPSPPNIEWYLPAGNVRCV